VLVIAFGGPEGMGDVRPFLANVLRGRRVAPERVEEVAKHYEHFGGVSPLAGTTRRQAEGLRAHLAARGLNVPVYHSMRNWHPLLPDTLKTMARDGVRRAIGFVCAAHRSYSSCTQYRRGLAAAVLCPIGFICDHVEVLYDLDIEAAQVCRDLSLPMARAATVNDNPLLLEMMADEVVKTWHRYRTGRPLNLSAANVVPTAERVARRTPV
jgi:protoheme ferro-lyase